MQLLHLKVVYAVGSPLFAERTVELILQMHLWPELNAAFCLGTFRSCQCRTWLGAEEKLQVVDALQEDKPWTIGETSADYAGL